MQEDSTRVPNRRLREYREQLGFTQEEMGERLSHVVWELHGKVVAISGGMVSKWERGERRPTKIYREAYRVLCTASDEELGFLKRRQLLRTAAAGTAAALTPGGRSQHHMRQAATASSPDGPAYAPQAAAAIRRAMLGTGAGATPRQDPDAQALGQRAFQAWQLRQSARYVALGEVLPTLIVDAESATRELSGDDQVHAHRALVHTYNTASSVLKKFGDFEFASIAADRAIRTAHLAGDPLLVSAASYRLANVLLPAGRLTEAKQVALAASNGLEPGLGSTPARLATWGGLVLTAALAAACQGNAAEAWELTGQATTASRQLGGDYTDLHTIFGPTNLAIYGVQIAAELGDGREALRRAARINPDRLPPMLLERRTHFLIDVARAHVHQADDRAAVGTLVAADRVAPEEVRFSPTVTELVSLLLRRERRSATPGLRELAINLRIAN